MMNVRHIYISPGHNFVGHHGRDPDDFPIIEVDEVECLADTGLKGDRYCGHAKDHKHITFFSMEVYRALCASLGVHDRAPSVFRRNVIVDGVDLNTLIGQAFEIQGIRFQGVEECRPCYWMDRAFGPGAEQALQGRGGLRARILTGGLLRRDAADQ